VFRLVISAILFATAASGQNGFSVVYDNARQVKLKGAIVRIEWTNPHAFLFVDVGDSAGAVANWAVEIGNPLELEDGGWKSTTVQIGDIVNVDGVPARGDAKQAFAKSMTLARTGAKIFALTPKKPPGAAGPAPAPRWPDGQVRLGPPPDQKGYWGSPTHAALFERTASGAPIAMNDEGLLANLSDADRVAPFQPWAKAIYLYRQRTLLKDDPFNRCLPPGGPRQFQTPHGFQFVEQRELGRILVLLGGGDRNWRIIYTDGRPPGQSAEQVLTYYGASAGRWENKETFVVESTGFNERFWFANGGLPHTEALQLTERFSRPDLNTLKYDVTVNDPRAYTRPWTGGWNIPWVPNQDIQEYFCEENAESTFNPLNEGR
jgi:hypothetical protein